MLRVYMLARAINSTTLFTITPCSLKCSYMNYTVGLESQKTLILIGRKIAVLYMTDCSIFLIICQVSLLEM